MKSIPFVPLVSLAVWLLAAPSVFAQTPAAKTVYRCDNNHYTQTPKEDPKAFNCKVLEGGNVTIVEGTRPQNQATAAPGNPVRVATTPPASAQPGQRVDAGDQRARDSDSRLILDSELRKAETRRNELAQEYNNGEPEKRGDEARNHQKYLDRVSELKTNLQRIDNDIAGIRRELGRSSASNGASGGTVLK
jgi:hypothetical protein